MSHRPEKNSERVEIRLTYSLKQRFLAACKRAGDTPSEALRGAMADYILQVDAAGKPNFFQELTMKLIHNPLKTATMALTSLAAFALVAAPSSADERLFKALDENGDGALTQTDSAIGDEVIYALDEDDSKSVTLDEFKLYSAYGVMVAIDDLPSIRISEDSSELTDEERKARAKEVFLEQTLISIDLSQIGKVKIVKEPMPDFEYGSEPPFSKVLISLIPPEKVSAR